MSSTTTHLGLVKPAGADAVSVLRTSIGANADINDAAFGRVSGGLQEGVIDAGSHMVTQDTGSNMNVKAASNTGTGVYVQDDGVTGQGLYYVAPTVSATTVAVGAAHATLPRIDRVLIDMAGTISVLAGTATSGATLDNLTGATGVPNSKLLLADVLVGATVTAITNAVIRDRRKWARGAYNRIIRAANAAAGNDYAMSGAPIALVDGTNLAPRVECSGVPVRVTLVGVFVGTVNAAAVFSPQVDGAGVDGMHSIGATPVVGEDLAHAYGSVQEMIVWQHTFVPAAGSHKIAPAFSAPTNFSIRARTAQPLTWIVEEIVRQNTANNSTTTG